MAANRKLPFGYTLRMGKVCVNEIEARLVLEIFTDYANGASYSQITDQLNRQPVPYNEPDKAWNKNMIARILGYEAYIGTNTNPAIITAEQWRAADAAKPSTRKPHEQNSDVKTIRQLARCAQCGSRLTLGTNGQSWERWKCHACGALTAKAITPRIRESLSCLMSQLLNTPELIDEPECQETHDSTTDQEEALRDALNAPEFDEGFARQMAYAFAVAQFDRISSADYETIRIREILVKKDGMDDLNTTLLKEITAAVLIHPDGRVSLRLKNNQIIEGR